MELSNINSVLQRSTETHRNSKQSGKSSKGDFRDTLLKMEERKEVRRRDDGLDIDPPKKLEERCEKETVKKQGDFSSKPMKKKDVIKALKAFEEQSGTESTQAEAPVMGKFELKVSLQNSESDSEITEEALSNIEELSLMILTQLQAQSTSSEPQVAAEAEGDSKSEETPLLAMGIKNKLSEIISLLEKDVSEDSTISIDELQQLVRNSFKLVAKTHKQDSKVDSLSLNNGSTISIEEAIKQELAQKLQKTENTVSKKNVDEISDEEVLSESEQEPWNTSAVRAAQDIINGGKPSSANSLINKKQLGKLTIEDKEEKILNTVLAKESDKGSREQVPLRFMNLLSQIENPTEAADAVEGKIVASKETFTQDIVKAVKFMEIKDLKDITVKILPKELGEVVIKLTMDKGVMKASLTATNEEAYKIINSNMTDLNDKLTQSQIKIQQFTLNIYNGDTTFFSGNSGRQNQDRSSNKSNGAKTSKEEISEIGSEVKDNSSVNILA